ncbi:MAG: methyltransferase domain-containing protein [Deltaproteobacteria bacterium]|nr:methyltransferase domain-containing protein [Deltaproteobacteria bacterium]MBW2225491.1 methyltransferase domain-containing protein [Deltaproteobacteria bacterium]MBW2405709.1 methyltransferase domain-containing protein [Deltaproteobacteria bacterium]
MTAFSANVVGWPDDAARDRLIGDWHIYQRTGGHRTSTDDLITAWYAVHRNPNPPVRYLDLGCGVGSVLLMVSHKLRPTTAFGVEVQAQSVDMATRAIAELPEHESHIEVRHADFRDFDFGSERYDLITGSPPYFPLNAGVLPDDPQRRACRFEERGGVEAYLEAATRAMTERSRFYIVFQTRWSERVTASATRHGLQLTGQADFSTRADNPDPFLTVFEFSRQPAETVHRFSCSVRGANGAITPEYQRIRLELGVG